MRSPIVFVSDLHLHAHKSHSTILPDGMNSRLRQSLDAFDEVVAHAKSVKAGAIIIPGDVFHVRGSIKPSTLNAVRKAMYGAVNAGIDVHIISGNHDMEDLSGGDTAVDCLDDIGGSDADVYIHNEPRVTSAGGWNINFIPYIHNTDEFKKIIEGVDLKTDLVVCHQGIDNFKPNPGMPDTGVDCEWLHKTLGKQIKLFTGHYHKPFNWKPAKAKEDRIINCGSLTQMDFGDEGQERGCWTLYDDGNVGFTRITSPSFVSYDAKRDAGIVKEVAGRFVKFRTPDAEQGEEFKKWAIKEGALSVAIEVAREFSTAHTESIKLASPEEMIASFIDINAAKYGARKADILHEYDRICK